MRSCSAPEFTERSCSREFAGAAAALRWRRPPNWGGYCLGPYRTTLALGGYSATQCAARLTPISSGGFGRWKRCRRPRRSPRRSKNARSTLRPTRIGVRTAGTRCGCRHAVVHRCVTCARHGGRTMSPLMAPLPRERVSPAPPFATTGVDQRRAGVRPCDTGTGPSDLQGVYRGVRVSLNPSNPPGSRHRLLGLGLPVGFPPVRGSPGTALADVQ